ncbi:hypothetical protein SSS_10778 [Sarcoptes scabiei]|nr:hypothetical protein SSS_10778 [Sarcoptes scabiei]
MEKDYGLTDCFLEDILSLSLSPMICFDIRLQDCNHLIRCLNTLFVFWQKREKKIDNVRSLSKMKKTELLMERNQSNNNRIIIFFTYSSFFIICTINLFLFFLSKETINF